MRACVYPTAPTMAVALVCAVLWCRPAVALNPAHDINQYAHTAWRIREGFTRGAIRAIAQTPDGYLWLGTDSACFVSTACRAVPWRPPADHHLSSVTITSLLVSRDGTLWIGTFAGLTSWKNGRLTQYPELDGRMVLGLAETRDGAVWAGGSGRQARLCAVRNGHMECTEDDGRFGHGVWGLYEDTHGTLWLGATDGLWRWRPGPPEFYSFPGELDSIRSFIADDVGLLFVTKSGINRLVNGRTEVFALPSEVPRSRPQTLLRDREGGLWIGTLDKGLVHIHQGRTDMFTRADGLSGDGIAALFEDREGNIWVATSDGLDRFHDVAVAAASASQGVPNAGVTSVLSARGGHLWLGARTGLSLWEHLRFTPAQTGSGRPDGMLGGDYPQYAL